MSSVVNLLGLKGAWWQRLKLPALSFCPTAHSGDPEFWLPLVLQFPAQCSNFSVPHLTMDLTLRKEAQPVTWALGKALSSPCPRSAGAWLTVLRPPPWPTFPGPLPQPGHTGAVREASQA
jgi:hypothetical protein